MAANPKGLPDRFTAAARTLGDWMFDVSSGIMRIQLRLMVVMLTASFGLAAPSALSAKERRFAPPVGFQIYCLRNPEECRGGGASFVTESQALVQQVKAVNKRVNLVIRPKSDVGPDVWTVGAREGDCEDFVLAKRKALMDQGFPSGALRVAYVKTTWGEGHAVLVVKTDKGDLVLDNLTPRVDRLAAMDHRLISMASADPLRWQ